MLKYLLILIFTLPLFPKNIQISGKIISKLNNEGVGYCTVIHKGTQNGTYTDSLGNFSFVSRSGEITLRAFTTGYQAKEISFYSENDTSGIEILIDIADFELEDVVVFAEGLGLRTMRKVLDRKENNKNKLNTYYYELYSKFIIQTDTLTAGRTTDNSDTTISSILESYSKSYYKTPDNYFNNIIKKRQSINVPPQANFTQLDNRFNAWNDFVIVFNEKIYSPFHPDSPDFYDFEFEKYIKDSLDRKLHKINIKPKGIARKAFSGYILIDSLEASPTYAELYPTEEVQLPFNAKMEYQQWFTKVDGFTLPSKLRAAGGSKAELFWIVAPRLDIIFENAQFNYKINIPLDDDLFDQRPVELAKNADENDPKFWKNNKLINLDKKEALAYDEIRKSIEAPDSIRGTNFITKSIAPISNKLRFINLPPFTGWEDVFKYNRITGFNPGVGLFGNLTETTKADIYTGYGIADETPFINANLKQYFNNSGNYYANINAYNRLQRTDNPNIIKDRTITFVSFLAGNDYGDYFYNQGGEFTLGYGWGQKAYIRKLKFVRPNFIEFFGRIENHKTAQTNTNFSLFNWNNIFRENPPSINDNFNTVGFKLNLNYSREKEISNLGFYFEGEYSDKLWNSSQNYSRYYGEAIFETRTLPLWKLKLRLSGAYSNGNVPFQKYFSLETATAGLTAPGAMRTLAPKEYYGSRFAAINFEHNFGEIFPGLFRIPNIASFGLEFILIANTAWSDFTQSEINRNSATNYPFNFTANNGDLLSDQLFTELGLGLNRLFILFRFDFMVRVSQGDGPQFRVTLSRASFD